MDYWKHKIAVVTGASSGIGSAITLDLAKHGITVIGLARRKNLIEQLATDNPNTPGKIYAHTCDVAKTESIVSAFKWIEDTFKTVHILINNTGRYTFGRVIDLELSHDEVRKTVDINLSGLIVCSREAYRLMQKHDDLAYIININSVLGHLTYQRDFYLTNVYSATKHGVTSHTEALRMELALSGNKRIRVSSVSPGLIKTEICEASGMAKAQSEEVFNNAVHLLPKDVSSSILFLLALPKSVNISELTIKPTGELF